MTDPTWARTARRALLATAAAVLASGCGSSAVGGGAKPPPPKGVQSFRSDLWRPVVVSGCSRRMHARFAPGQRYLYFSCLPPTGPLVAAAAARRLTDRDTSGRALRLLLRGPSRRERAAGFVSNFGPRTAHLRATVTVHRGLAVVDLDPAIRRVPFMFVSVQDVAQITSTVGQFPRIRRVAITLGGRPLCSIVDVC